MSLAPMIRNFWFGSGSLDTATTSLLPSNFTKSSWTARAGRYFIAFRFFTVTIAPWYFPKARAAVFFPGSATPQSNLTDLYLTTWAFWRLGFPPISLDRLLNNIFNKELKTKINLTAPGARKKKKLGSFLEHAWHELEVFESVEQFWRLDDLRQLCSAPNAPVRIAQGLVRPVQARKVTLLHRLQ